MALYIFNVFQMSQVSIAISKKRNKKEVLHGLNQYPWSCVEIIEKLRK